MIWFHMFPFCAKLENRVFFFPEMDVISVLHWYILKLLMGLHYPRLAFLLPIIVS